MLTLLFSGRHGIRSVVHVFRCTAAIPVFHYKFIEKDSKSNLRAHPEVNGMHLLAGIHFEHNMLMEANQSDGNKHVTGRVC